MTPSQASLAGWTMTPSPFRLHAFWLRAYAACLRQTPRQSGNAGFQLRVSREFAKRLKRARIYVEGA